MLHRTTLDKHFNLTSFRMSGKGCCGLVKLIYPRSTKQSLFIFGGKTGIARECERQREIGGWVIHPMSTISHIHSATMFLLTFFALLSLPLEIAFANDFTGNSTFILTTFAHVTDLLFCVDILITFRLGILTDDYEVAILDLKAIRQKYLKSWFLLDLVSSVPLDLIIDFSGMKRHSSELVAGKLVRIIGFLKLAGMVRVLRGAKLVKFLRELEQVSNANFEAVRQIFRTAYLFLMLFLLCHWNGCVQYYIPMSMMYPSNCWIVKEDLMNSTFGEKYSFSVFRALSHVTGISYGSSTPPATWGEMWVVMSSMVCGAVMYGILLAHSTVAMTKVDVPAKKFKNKINHLEGYMAYAKLPKLLRQRLTTYYQTRYGEKWFDENEIFSTLSKSEREETAAFLCCGLLDRSPLFQCRDVDFLSLICMELRSEVFQEGDTIAVQHAPGNRLYFILHGQIMMETDFYQEKLQDGDSFGESCLISGQYVANARALSHCELYTLSVYSIHKVLESFPDIKKDIDEFVRQHQEDLTASQRLCSTGWQDGSTSDDED